MTKESQEMQVQEQKMVEFFSWEKLDYVDKVKKAFNL